MTACPTHPTLAPTDVFTALRAAYPRLTLEDVTHPLRWAVFVALWQSRRCRAIREANDLPRFAKFVIAQNRNKRSPVHRLARILRNREAPVTDPAAGAPSASEESTVPVEMSAPSTVVAVDDVPCASEAPAGRAERAQPSTPIDDVPVASETPRAPREKVAEGRNNRWQALKAARELVQLLGPALRDAQGTTIEVGPEVLAQAKELLEVAMTSAPRASKTPDAA